jgi:hypothetical protein
MNWISLFGEMDPHGLDAKVIGSRLLEYLDVIDPDVIVATAIAFTPG